MLKGVSTLTDVASELDLDGKEDAVVSARTNASVEENLATRKLDLEHAHAWYRDTLARRGQVGKWHVPNCLGRVLLLAAVYTVAQAAPVLGVELFLWPCDGPEPTAAPTALPGSAGDEVMISTACGEHLLTPALYPPLGHLACQVFFFWALAHSTLRGASASAVFRDVARHLLWVAALAAAAYAAAVASLGARRVMGAYGWLAVTALSTSIFATQCTFLIRMIIVVRRDRDAEALGTVPNAGPEAPVIGREPEAPDIVGPEAPDQGTDPATASGRPSVWARPRGGEADQSARRRQSEPRGRSSLWRLALQACVPFALVDTAIFAYSGVALPVAELLPRPEFKVLLSLGCLLVVKTGGERLLRRVLLSRRRMTGHAVDLTLFTFEMCIMPLSRLILMSMQSTSAVFATSLLTSAWELLQRVAHVELYRRTFDAAAGAYAAVAPHAAGGFGGVPPAEADAFLREVRRLRHTETVVTANVTGDMVAEYQVANYAAILVAVTARHPGAFRLTPGGAPSAGGIGLALLALYAPELASDALALYAEARRAGLPARGFLEGQLQW